MHPSNEIRSTLSSRLEGKRVVLGVTGSIAAVECVKLARLLIRHGAEVFPVMTAAAQRIIHPDALGFATGNKPITEIDGGVQHVALCGEVPDKADLLLIAPSTANTISKIAHGIGDTPVTTFATTALGSGVPIIVVPAMHASMYRNRAVIENCDVLARLGVEVVRPRIVEQKAKPASTDEILARVIRTLGRKELAGAKVLVISGGTSEPIDDVRVITNASTGRTGLAIAEEAYYRGADVTLWASNTSLRPPDHIRSRRFGSVKDLVGLLAEDDLSYKVILVPAAISDYTIRRQGGKISSKLDKLRLDLVPTPKVIDRIRKDFVGYLVGFKAEAGVSENELIRRAKAKLAGSRLELVVANDVMNVREDRTKAILVGKSGKPLAVSGTRETLAKAVLDRIVEDIAGP